jgi:hypothetical protein
LISVRTSIAIMPILVLGLTSLCIKQKSAIKSQPKSKEVPLSTNALFKELNDYKNWIITNPPSLAGSDPLSLRRFGVEFEFGCKNCSNSKNFADVSYYDPIEVYADLRDQFPDLVAKPSQIRKYPFIIKPDEIAPQIRKKSGSRYCKKPNRKSGREDLEIYCFLFNLNPVLSERENLEIYSAYSLTKNTVAMSFLEKSSVVTGGKATVVETAKELKKVALANETLATDVDFDVSVKDPNGVKILTCLYITREKQVFCGYDTFQAATADHIQAELEKKGDVSLISLENPYLVLEDILDPSAGFEVRTKPLDSRSIDKALLVFSTLKKMGAKGVSDQVAGKKANEVKDRSTGLHVHIEAESQITGQDTIRVLNSYFELESDLLKIFSPSKVRIKSNYLRPYDDKIKESIVRLKDEPRLAGSNGMKELSDVIYSGEENRNPDWAKFHLFNLLNVLKNKTSPHTFECRLYDAEYKKSFNEATSIEISSDDYPHLAIASCYYIVEKALNTKNFIEFKNSLAL